MDLIEKISARYRTPKAVQQFLREQFSYNFETQGETLRSAQTCLQLKKAHCLEATLVAAALLERHGYPPLVMSLESVDNLDHVIYVFKERTGWGAIGRSREPGLHGRAPKFRTLRQLAWSYWEPFIDKTGRLTGFGVEHLDRVGCDWRRSSRNVWKVEQHLIDLKHEHFISSPTLLRRARALKKLYLDIGPLPLKRGWW